jgi:maltose O-acetyltransferase
MVEDGRSMRERMLAGDLYIWEDPEILADAQRAQQLCHLINTGDVTRTDEQRQLFAELLGSFGEDTVIMPPFRCDLGYQITFGRGSFANYGLIALDVAKITIGDVVLIGPNVQLLTPTHPLEPEPRRRRWEAAKPIVIEDNVWLGGGVIVCPGVTIGENSVIGAGAVVTKDVPPNVIAVGNPARVLRPID